MQHQNNDKLKILILAGPSNSGKSSVAKSLVEDEPTKFHKLMQVTTRKPRFDGEDGYIFLTDMGYEALKPNLIARLGKESFQGSQYGTIPDFDPNKINIIIAVVDAILDIENSIRIGRLNAECFTIGIEKDFKDLDERPDRDKDFIKEEYKVFNYVDAKISASNDDYVTTSDIISILEDHTTW